MSDMAATIKSGYSGFVLESLRSWLYSVITLSFAAIKKLNVDLEGSPHW
jgi:hypothetical protein